MSHDNSGGRSFLASQVNQGSMRGVETALNSGWSGITETSTIPQDPRIATLLRQEYFPPPFLEPPVLQSRAPPPPRFEGHIIPPPGNFTSVEHFTYLYSTLPPPVPSSTGSLNFQEPSQLEALWPRPSTKPELPHISDQSLSSHGLPTPRSDGRHFMDGLHRPDVSGSLMEMRHRKRASLPANNWMLSCGDQTFGYPPPRNIAERMEDLGRGTEIPQQTEKSEDSAFSLDEVQDSLDTISGINEQERAEPCQYCRVSITNLVQ